MRTQFKQNLLAALITGMLLPVAAQAAEADLLKRIEALAQQNERLAQQLEELKGQVKANEVKAAKAAAPVATAPAVDTAALDDLKSQVKKLEDKSLGKWLTVGGDYHFRYDYLKGETKTFTDVNATFKKVGDALQGDFFANPSSAAGSSRYFGAPQAGGMSTAGALSGLMGFSQAMGNVATYDQARAFLGMPSTMGMLQGIGGFAQTIAPYTPENNNLWTNRFALDLNAKATQDVSVTAHLAMYKVFGAQNENAVTNSGSAPFFADRVGVFDGTLSHVPSTTACMRLGAILQTRRCGSPLAVGHPPAAHPAT
jgi:hypothetical protein